MNLNFSNLQRRTDSDDFVSIGSIDLQQNRKCLLQHRTPNIIQTPAWFVNSDVGDLTVSSWNYRIINTLASFQLFT